MDSGSKLRISKVDNVTCWREGKRVEGTLHLTSHHIIFSYFVQTAEPIDPEAKRQTRESWLTYPMIEYCTYRPAPPASHNPPSLRIRFRDFTYVSFHFLTDKEARSVYDSIRNLTIKLGSLDKLYAFSYHPAGPERKIDGWNVYNPKKEFARLGITEKKTDKGWRITDINKDYTYSPTYPAMLVVPATISDNVLKHAVTHRSRARIPALTYLHPVNNCSITRCAQPMVGIRGKRSAQDEKLVEAIWGTSKIRITSVHSVPATPLASQSTSDVSSLSEPSSLDASYVDTELLEDGALSEALAKEQNKVGGGKQVYGAQQNNVIVDARPQINAIAQSAAGRGSENMDHYGGASKAFLGIDNIHVMRKSLNRVIEALKDSDITTLPPNRDLLVSSNWVKHISNLLEGAAIITRTIGVYHSHVIIHCSDGWDRTSQLSALSQLCLDPYYRTLEGFAVLVEKDWLSFGHMFRQRSGPLSSERWFEIENERVAAEWASTNGTNDSPERPTGASGNVFEGAISRGIKLWKGKREESDSDPEASAAVATASSSPAANGDKMITKVDEKSPMFHQFLDATYQLMHQFPTRFELNSRFLRRLLYHLYSCQYGTFLFDSEKERVDRKAKERTKSVWSFFLSRREEFTNKDYDPVVDDHIKGKERILLPDSTAVRWWAEGFGRKDAEMNGPGALPTTQELAVPVVEGVETADETNALGRSSTSTRLSTQVSAGKNGISELSANLGALGVGIGSPSSGRSSPSRLSALLRDRPLGLMGSAGVSPKRVGSPSGKEELGVEMS